MLYRMVTFPMPLTYGALCHCALLFLYGPFTDWQTDLSIAWIYRQLQ